MLAIALAAALYAVAGGGSPTAGTAHVRTLTSTGLQRLPLAARGPASAALAAEDPQYAVQANGLGLHAQSPGQQLSLTFGSAGVQVSAGSTRVVLDASAAGLGSRLAPLPARAPRAERNRVLYELRGLGAWYANGPLGLEQGFTFAHAPAGAEGPLTVAIALGGNARPALSGGAVTFAHAGGPTLRYGGLVATDAHGRLLRSWMQLDGHRLLLRVQARGAAYPVRIDPFVQQAQLPVTGVSSVALSQDGQTALVGEMEEGTEGTAYVFTRSGETWTEQARLTPGDGKKDQFGASVALSADGDTAVIGGPRYRNDQGGAWVFTRSGETWTQQGEPISRTADGRFGFSVAIDGAGDTIMVGAPQAEAESGGELFAGAAWVFTLSGDTWSQQGEKMVPDNGVGTTQFGDSVALSGDGDTALIGGKGNETGNGAAWIYDRSGEAWTQAQTLTPSEESAEDGHFGASVALSSDGSTAIVGGPGPEPATKNSIFTGDAWVFALDGETWTQQGPELTPGERVQEQHFGAGVALSGDGDTALVGGSNVRHGGVWFFARSGDTWSHEGQKLAIGGKENVALDGEGVEALAGADALVAREAGGTPPEFGRCVKVAVGAFEKPGCTESGSGDYEWEPGAAKPRATLAGATATLETVHGAKITCAHVSGSGEFSGTKAIAGEALALTGCESEGQQCTSAGAGAGEIDTSTLEAELGVEERASKAASSKLALDLVPAAGAEAFAQFACGASEVTLRGSVIAPLKTNKMESSYTLKFSAAKGKQKPEHLAEAPEDVLEESVDHGAFVQAGLTATLTQTDEEALEANSAF